MVDQRSQSRKESDCGRCGLVIFEALPKFLQDNECLRTRHMPQTGSVAICFTSIFRMHSQTLNIWTHLIALIWAAFHSVQYLLLIPDDFWQGVTFSLFFCGACVCLGFSAAFHTFLCHSEPVFKFMAKLDYCGVITLIMTSGYPWIYFAFYCHSTLLKLVYISSTSVSGLLAMVVVIDDQFSQPKYRRHRAALFVGLGLTGIFPTVHYILSDGSRLGYYEWLFLMAIFYIGGAAIYSIRVPEAIWPGYFDVWFHSHQLMHLCVVGGIWASYSGASRLADHVIQLRETVCLV